MTSLADVKKIKTRKEYIQMMDRVLKFNHGQSEDEAYWQININNEFMLTIFLCITDLELYTDLERIEDEEHMGRFKETAKFENAKRIFKEHTGQDLMLL